jgi:hypothetical protein
MEFRIADAKSAFRKMPSRWGISMKKNNGITQRKDENRNAQAIT